MSTEDKNSESVTDIGAAVRENIGVDKERGSFTLFGKKIEVGREIAVTLAPLIEQVESEVTTKGAAHVRRIGTSLAESFLPKNQALQVGEVAELAWRFGLPAVDVGLGIKTAVQGGAKRMKELSTEASVVLAANNANSVMLSGYSALAHERAQIFKEGRKTVLSSIAGVVKKLPSIMLNVWQYNIDLIDDPERLFDKLPKDASVEAQERVNKRVAELKALKSPAETLLDPDDAEAKLAKPAAPVGTSLTDTFKRLFKPKTLGDYEENMKTAQFGPVIGGLLGKIFQDTIVGKGGEKETAWRRIKELEMAIINNEPSSGREIEDEVRAVFVQHARDKGLNHKLVGNKFNHLVEEVSEALATGGVTSGLHPQALVEMLDNEKVIKFSQQGITYGGTGAIKHSINELVDKYTANVTHKEFFKETPFTELDAVKVFNNLNDEERSLYVMMFPTGLLEKAGAKREDVVEAREIGQQTFTRDLEHMLSNLLQAGGEELKKQGVKQEMIEELEAIGEDYEKALRRGRGSRYISENLKDTTALVRNIAVTAHDQDEFWRNYVGSQSNKPDLEQLRQEYDPQTGKRRVDDESRFRRMAEERAAVGASARDRVQRRREDYSDDQYPDR